MTYELGTISEIGDRTISIDDYIGLKREHAEISEKTIMERQMVFVYTVRMECGLIPDKDIENIEKIIKLLEKNENLLEQFGNVVKKSGRYLVN